HRRCGARQFRSACTTRIRAVAAPITCPAATQSPPTCASTLARTTRANCGTYRKPIAKMITGSELPNTATNTAASAMPGKDMITSRMRISTSEASLAAVAAIEPITAATTRAPAVAARPITSEERVPWRMRENTSRPIRSVPNQCSPLGACTGTPVDSGSCGDASGAATAASASSTRRPSAILLGSGRVASPPRGARLGEGGRDLRLGGMPDAREPGGDDDVQQIDEAVHHDERDGGGEGHALHQEHVVAGDPVEDQLTHRLDVEDDLDDDR